MKVIKAKRFSDNKIVSELELNTINDFGFDIMNSKPLDKEYDSVIISYYNIKYVAKTINK